MQPESKRQKVAAKPTLLGRLIDEGQRDKIVPTNIFIYLDAMEYCSIRRTSKGVLAALENSYTLAQAQWERVCRSRPVLATTVSLPFLRLSSAANDVGLERGKRQLMTMIGHTSIYMFDADAHVNVTTLVACAPAFNVGARARLQGAPGERHVELAMQVTRLAAKAASKNEKPYFACLVGFRPWRCVNCRHVSIEYGSNDTIISEAFRQLLGGPICGVCEPSLAIAVDESFYVSMPQHPDLGAYMRVYALLDKERLAGRIKSARIDTDRWYFVSDLQRIWDRVVSL